MNIATHPAWCVSDRRYDTTTDEKCHPDDFTTWHNGASVTIPVARHRGVTQLDVRTEMFDPDRKDGSEVGPEIYVEGDDGSGWSGGLILPLDAAEAVAREMLRQVEAARR